MGVPSFYRWLSRKYPKIVLDVVEERGVDLPSGQKGGIDTTKPNPNGFEVDNLYLDMNGIIHPCCHPEDGEAPDDEDDMVRRVFLYVDRIFAMVRPRKVLYMAIDGVAPRAKMNQQRSRRFRSAKEITDKEELEEELRKEWEDKGYTPPPRKRRPWDSNVITPGTPFMAKLSRSLHWYINDRLTNDPGWRGVKIIFSDAKVPGEGEHKIMKYIRLQRAAPGYDPNVSHVLYGMDADLIMLGLATHDPHFRILRETIVENTPRLNGPRCFLCGVVGHRAEECSGIQEEEKKKAEESGKIAAPVPEPGLMDKPFQWLQLSVLREYLAHDLYVPNLPFAWDLERCIDDWVFLAFFVGNDFLPHLPLLEIREGAIERLVGIYKRLLPSLGGYISEDAGSLNMSRIDVILSDLGVVEDSIFKSRKSKQDYFKQRDANRSAQLSARRAQTIKQRESALNFAKEQDFSAVSSGINTHGSRAVQPHIKQQLKKEQQIKTEIRTDDCSGPAPIYSAAKLAGAKRKSQTTEESITAVGEEAARSKKSKKSKLADGAGSKASESEVDSDDDAADASYKPTNDSSSSSSSDSDDDEGDQKNKKKRRKAKQAAKKAATASASSAVSVKSQDKSESKPVDHLKHDSTGALAKSMDAQAATLDFGAILNAKLRKMERPEPSGDEDEAARDPVRFGEDGWKPRYYSTKMHIDRDRAEDGVIFHKLFKSYAEGLAWVMKYYYEGCTSWNWYYPFHYAPMASDLTNLDRYKIEFEMSEPFKPIGQLMGVLPAKSAHALPAVCQELMVNPLSPIIDFYPESFALDLNGQQALWKAVALLPWIEEKRLLDEIAKIEPQFNDEEKDRNSLGVDYLFVHKSNLLANSIYALYNAHPPESLDGKTPLECSRLKQESVDTAESLCMSGTISPYLPLGELDGSLASEVGLHTIEDISVMSVIFQDPPHRTHVCALLPGLIPPKPLLVEADLEEAARGGPQQRDTNQSRNNMQRHNNQRESNRQQQGVVGHHQQHGGQAQGDQPKFGAAPSHFQQGDVSGRIWSSGFNQRDQTQQQPQQHHQQLQGGAYQTAHQHQRPALGQQQQQQPYRYSQAAGAYPQQQQQSSGPYHHQQASAYPTHPQAQQQQPAASYSHARGPLAQQPARGPSHFAALQAQIQASTAAQRALQQQRQGPRR